MRDWATFDDDVVKAYHLTVEEMLAAKGLTIERAEKLAKDSGTRVNRAAFRRAIGRSVRMTREVRGLTRPGLAAAAGLHLRVLIAIERGTAEHPSLLSFCRIAHALQVSLDELILVKGACVPRQQLSGD